MAEIFLSLEQPHSRPYALIIISVAIKKKKKKKKGYAGPSKGSQTGLPLLQATKAASTAFLVPAVPLRTQKAAGSECCEKQHSQPARLVKNLCTFKITYHLAHLAWCWPTIWQQELLLEEQEQQVLAVSAAPLAVWS